MNFILGGAINGSMKASFVMSLIIFPFPGSTLLQMSTVNDWNNISSTINIKNMMNAASTVGIRETSTLITLSHCKS